MKKITKIASLLALAVIFAAFISCNKKSAESSDSQKKTIRAATKGRPVPYITVDKDGKLDGYDIAVFNEVFSRLPQYTVNLIVTDDALTGVLSGQYDISVNNWSYNDKRAVSYYYSYPYDKIVYDFMQRKGDIPLTSFADAAERGYTLAAGPGNNVANAVEIWNENHPDKKIKIEYTEADTAIILQQIADGKVDFMVHDHPIALNYIETYGAEDTIELHPVSEEASVQIANLKAVYSYYLLPKDEKGAQLREEVNKVLKEMHDDGTLLSISQKYFQADQVPESSNYEKTIN
ncbi:MAG: transporter substrate-binding domain-containing protein [Treponema sp.]|uniref:transporter substrate-binding domain-containing protein n=1 Tax=Treponema sp. TaxID=166 RepID=UPI0025FB5F8A|nr:transporter substrate-binding domain-containing protein [Treponema sp.]MBQ9280879.1 transporter substrate-binding domain-containing protein [Treponema sp.]